MMERPCQTARAKGDVCVNETNNKANPQPATAQPRAPTQPSAVDMINRGGTPDEQRTVAPESRFTRANDGGETHLRSTQRSVTSQDPDVATSVSSDHHQEDVSQPQAGRVASKRPHTAIHNVELSPQQRPRQASCSVSANPLDSANLVLEEIVYTGGFQPPTRDAGATNQMPDPLTPPTTDAHFAKRHRPSHSSESASGFAYEVGQLFPTQPMPSITVEPLDLFQGNLGTIGHDFAFGQGLDMQDYIGLNPQENLDYYLGESSIQMLYAPLRSANKSLPSPESFGSAEHGDPANEALARWPKVLKENSTSPPKLDIKEDAYQKFLFDSLSRLGQRDYVLPIDSRQQAQHFLNATTAQMLNAQFDEHGIPLTLNSPQSTGEWTGGDDYTAKVSEIRPLWMMQTRVLLSLYASLGEDATIAVAELERLGLFTKEYRLRRDELRRKPEPSLGFTWKEWIEKESNKRLLCGMFIHSNLLVILYDILPGFDITQDLEYEVVDEERLWNAPTAAQWQNLRYATDEPKRTFRAVLSDMLADRARDGPTPPQYYISSFTALVVMHAVNIHVWHLSQVSQALSKSLQVAGHASNILMSQTLTTLAKCRDILQQSRETAEPLWDDPQKSLLFNGEAMLRVAYTRLFTSGSMPQRFTLFYSSSEDRPAALKAFVAAKQDRGPLITKAVSHILESFFIPIKMGYLLVRKTAAFVWSVEYAISSWGCAILLCQWINSIETQKLRGSWTEAEAHLIEQIQAALEDIGSDYEEGRSLAAAVARAWGSLNNDVWVWSITAKFGHTLAELAQVYDSSFSELRR
ncbi:3-hydroxyisobutyrate dehydrogenase [Seiridium cupressi]